LSSSRPVEAMADMERRYSGGEERPLGSYLILVILYCGWLVALVAGTRARKVRLPESINARDLALLTVAVFRGSRLVTKDSITAFARSPFTRFEGPSGAGEVEESVPGRGFQHAVGELLTCPFCLSVWLTTTLTVSFISFPRQTRWVCTVLAAVAGADALQFAYSVLEQAAS
jgi:hypothetical protein